MNTLNEVEFLNLVRCPDCFNQCNVTKNLMSEKVESTISCDMCSWTRPISSDLGLIDLLASKPLVVDDVVKKQAIMDFYYQQFDTNLYSCNIVGNGWSAADESSSVKKHFFLEQMQKTIRGMINLTNQKKVLIDFSAGAGDYTFENSKFFDIVLHCDIDGNGLVSAKARADILGITNIIFIRCDYLQLPFAKDICDVALLIDSLEYYGPVRDKKVINNIYGILANKGLAAFDFHRKRPMKQNNVLFEYNKKDINSVCESSAFKVTSLGDWVIGRISSFCFSNKMIYLIINSIKILPPVRSIRLMRKGL